MAILVDLVVQDEPNEAAESTSTNPHHHADSPNDAEATIKTSPATTHPEGPASIASNQSPCNLALLAAAYPVIRSIASHLDHTDLCELAGTCKQMRENMLQFRKSLLVTSLECSNVTEMDSLNGKLRNRCVRDLVASCGTCGEPTCRNCISKSIITEEHRNRLACRVRRICRQCQIAPEVLRQQPKSTPYPKICMCARKLLWQCVPCFYQHAPVSKKNSFLSLLHHEKLQLLEHISCPHFFANPRRPPLNQRRVWVEACPSTNHALSNPPFFNPSCIPSNKSGVICAMERYAGGWAWQDVNTGYIYHPSPTSCIGATKEWWSRVLSNPNEGGFIAYPYPIGGEGEEEDITKMPCTHPTIPRWRREAGKGRDERVVAVALRNLERVSPDLRNLSANWNFKLSWWGVDEMHTALAEEKGDVRGWCAWCDDIVLSREDERHLEF